jgi:hypothetical protein
VKITTLRKVDFNLKSKMGSAFAYKFKFNLLDGLARGYKTAFAGIDAVQSIFASAALKKLFAVRNLIVHRGCEMDETFLERMKADPIIAHAKPGEILRLDGNAVIEHSTAGCGSAGELLTVVSAWLEANPE